MKMVWEIKRIKRIDMGNGLKITFLVTITIVIAAVMVIRIVDNPPFSDQQKCFCIPQ